LRMTRLEHPRWAASEKRLEVTVRVKGLQSGIWVLTLGKWLISLILSFFICQVGTKMELPSQSHCETIRQSTEYWPIIGGLSPQWLPVIVVNSVINRLPSLESGFMCILGTWVLLQDVQEFWKAEQPRSKRPGPPEWDLSKYSSPWFCVFLATWHGRSSLLKMPREQVLGEKVAIFLIYPTPSVTNYSSHWVFFTLDSMPWLCHLHSLVQVT
jgi:hypothetical protein